ncbi:MAG: sigma-54-dependent Fis family transcriptional regulator, partial [Myxococcales bacterium]|nr:sigma-54-dependent Fis family transcriptional regulator [Myxococcales bacterium]
VVMITAHATTAQAVAAMREGAYDYVQKPFRNDELRATVEKALDKHEIVIENKRLRREVEGVFVNAEVVGKSVAMRRVMELVERVAPSPSSVLLTGESGVGKEMVARALHRISPRSVGPFVAINCGALPEALMESELFGHRKGAFTGATQDKDGLFRAAHGGTLLLDEIGELPSALQVKLLRVLQERQVRPVGDEHSYDFDVRIIAATNRDLEGDVASGAFRQDLFYRLNVIRIEIPPLRERVEDIAVLAKHFLAKHSLLQGKNLSFSQEALRWICSQPYPGNVRELENFVERAVTMTLSGEVSLDDIPEARERDPRTSLGAPVIPEGGLDLVNYLEDVEKSLILQALERTDGNRTKAAKVLGMTFRTLRYRLAKYNLGEGDEGPTPSPSDR